MVAFNASFLQKAGTHINHNPQPDISGVKFQLKLYPCPACAGSSVCVIQNFTIIVFCQSIMSLLLLHLILAEECLCKIVKFLMTPQEDDYKLCPTCRGYNVIKRNSLPSEASTFAAHHLLLWAWADSGESKLPGENWLPGKLGLNWHLLTGKHASKGLF